MYLDNKKLHKDILQRLNAIKKSQRQVTETQINISRSTLHRLSTNKPITMETFLKLLQWLDFEANRYVKKEKRHYNKF